MERTIYIKIMKWIRFGHELNEGLVELMERTDKPLTYIDKQLKELGYSSPMNTDFIEYYNDDPVAVDEVMYTVVTTVVIQQIAYLYRLDKHGCKPIGKKGRGKHFCDLVVGTIDDRSSWHEVGDLEEQSFIEFDSVSNFERYDTLAAERGRIRKKTVKKGKNGQPLPFGITYVFRDPSIRQYKK